MPMDDVTFKQVQMTTLALQSLRVLRLDTGVIVDQSGAAVVDRDGRALRGRP